MFQLLSRYWWVLVVRGLIAILFGILAFTLPMQVLSALVLAFGACAFADGVFTIATAVAGRRLTARWWVLLAEGVLGLAIGVLTFFQPALTALALFLFIASWAVLLGLFQIVAAIELRHEIRGEWWLVLGGALGVVFGVLALLWPAEAVFTVLWIVGAYAIVWGAMMLVGGFDVRRLWKLGSGGAHAGPVSHA